MRSQTRDLRAEAVELRLFRRLVRLRRRRVVAGRSHVRRSLRLPARLQRLRARRLDLQTRGVERRARPRELLLVLLPQLPQQLAVPFAPRHVPPTRRGGGGDLPVLRLRVVPYKRTSW